MLKKQQEIIRILKYGTTDIEVIPYEELNIKEKQWIKEDEDYTYQQMISLLNREEE